ncbi:unnamed protein product [Leptidea sinapis]|uniref:Uncharacterized protein n=1 Tax=Leptidea sinapis TaxID=189913 RepID=A0A5E4Q4F9_9NEOP|nr:unnamed protein product [Leptidea sinapis]
MLNYDYYYYEEQKPPLEQPWTCVLHLLQRPELYRCCRQPGLKTGEGPLHHAPHCVTNGLGRRGPPAVEQILAAPGTLTALLTDSRCGAELRPRRVHPPHWTTPRRILKGSHKGPYYVNLMATLLIIATAVKVMLRVGASGEGPFTSGTQTFSLDKRKKQVTLCETVSATTAPEGRKLGVAAPKIL